MGPYCKFCDNRCFVSITTDTPKEIQKAYGHYSIMATCAEGQRLEKNKVGYCYADIEKLAQKISRATNTT